MVTGKRKTQQVIKDSFMDLYARKNFFTITVKEICDVAGLHRTTFYLHYDNIESLLREIEDEILIEMAELSKITKFMEIGTKKNNDYSDNRWLLLEYMRTIKDYLLPLLNPYNDLHFIISFKKLIYKGIEETLEKHRCTYGHYQDYLIYYMCNGIVEIIYQWLKKDDISIEEISSLLTKINSMHPFLESKS